MVHEVAFLRTVHTLLVQFLRRHNLRVVSESAINLRTGGYRSQRRSRNAGKHPRGDAEIVITLVMTPIKSVD